MQYPEGLLIALSPCCFDSPRESSKLTLHFFGRQTGSAFGPLPHVPERFSNPNDESLWRDAYGLTNILRARLMSSSSGLSIHLHRLVDEFQRQLDRSAETIKLRLIVGSGQFIPTIDYEHAINSGDLVVCFLLDLHLATGGSLVLDSRDASPRTLDGMAMSGEQLAEIKRCFDTAWQNLEAGESPVWVPLPQDDLPEPLKSRVGVVVHDPCNVQLSVVPALLTLWSMDAPKEPWVLHVRADEEIKLRSVLSNWMNQEIWKAERLLGPGLHTVAHLLDVMVRIYKLADSPMATLLAAQHAVLTAWNSQHAQFCCQTNSANCPNLQIGLDECWNALRLLGRKLLYPDRRFNVMWPKPPAQLPDELAEMMSRTSMLDYGWNLESLSTCVKRLFGDNTLGTLDSNTAERWIHNGIVRAKSFLDGGGEVLWETEELDKLHELVAFVPCESEPVLIAYPPDNPWMVLFFPAGTMYDDDQLRVTISRVRNGAFRGGGGAGPEPISFLFEVRTDTPLGTEGARVALRLFGATGSAGDVFTLDGNDDRRTPHKLVWEQLPGGSTLADAPEWLPANLRGFRWATAHVRHFSWFTVVPTLDLSFQTIVDLALLSRMEECRSDEGSGPVMMELIFTLAPAFAAADPVTAAEQSTAMAGWRLQRLWRLRIPTDTELHCSLSRMTVDSGGQASYNQSLQWMFVVAKPRAALQVSDTLFMSEDSGNNSLTLLKPRIWTEPHLQECKLDPVVSGRLRSNVKGVGDVAIEVSDGLKVLKLMSLHKNSTDLRHLQIERGVGDAGAFALAEVIATNRIVEELSISRSGIGDAGAVALVQALSVNVTVAKLKLKSSTIGNDGCLAFAIGLTKLTELSLSDNRIGDDGASNIASGLVNPNTKLTTLDLSGNQIGRAGATAIASGLASADTKLTTLNLSNNQIGDAGATAIASKLASANTKLTTLDLSYNQIGDDGAAVIAIGLASAGTKLTTLDLSYNQIGDAGASAIASKLAIADTKLTSLYLSFNQIGDHGATAIGLGLASANTKLTKLDLSGNLIGDAGAAAIVSGLDSADTKLTKLDLSENYIGDAGASCLVSPTASYPALRLLNLESNSVTHIPPSFHDFYAKNMRLNIQLLGNKPIYPAPSLWDSISELSAFFRELADAGERTLSRSRIMVIGQCGTGKTTLTMALRMCGIGSEDVVEEFLKSLKRKTYDLSVDEFEAWVNDDLLEHAPATRFHEYSQHFGGMLTGAAFLDMPAAKCEEIFRDDDTLAGSKLARVYRLFREELTQVATMTPESTSLTNRAPYAFLLDIPHIWTAGVRFEPWHIDEAETIGIADFAGQMEFFPSHQLFMWSRQAVYILVFDVRRPIEQTKALFASWLDLLKTSRDRGADQSAQPAAKLVLVATFTDQPTDERVDYKEDLLVHLDKHYAGIVDIVGYFAPRYDLPAGGDVDKLRDRLLELARERDKNFPVPSSYEETSKRILEESRKRHCWPVLEKSALAGLGFPSDRSKFEAMFGTLSDLALIKRTKDNHFVLNPMSWLSHMLGALLHPKKGLQAELRQHRRNVPTVGAHVAARIIEACSSSGVILSDAHKQQLLPLLADFDVCFEMEENSFVFPSALPPFEPTDRHHVVVKEGDCVAARRYELADGFAIIPPAFEVELMHLVCKLVASCEDASLCLLRNGLLVFKVDSATVRIMVQDKTSYQTPSLRAPPKVDIIVSAAKSQSDLLRHLLNTATLLFVNALVKIDHQALLGNSVRFTKHVLEPVLQGPEHVALSYARTEQPNTSLALCPSFSDAVYSWQSHSRRDGPFEQICLYASVKLGSSSMELEWPFSIPPSVFLLCTDERIVNEEVRATIFSTDPHAAMLRVILSNTEATMATLEELKAWQQTILGTITDLDAEDYPRRFTFEAAEQTRLQKAQVKYWFHKKRYLQLWCDGYGGACAHPIKHKYKVLEAKERWAKFQAFLAKHDKVEFWLSLATKLALVGVGLGQFAEAVPTEIRTSTVADMLQKTGLFDKEMAAAGDAVKTAWRTADDATRGRGRDLVDVVSQHFKDRPVDELLRESLETQLDDLKKIVLGGGEGMEIVDWDMAQDDCRKMVWAYLKDHGFHDDKHLEKRIDTSTAGKSEVLWLCQKHRLAFDKAGGGKIAAAAQPAGGTAAPGPATPPPPAAAAKPSTRTSLV